MKKAAAAAALLALMLGMSLRNVRYLNAAVADMTGNAELCRVCCRDGDMKAAETALAKAGERWEGMDVFAHVFLRQTETDAVEDALSAVLNCLRTGDAYAAEVALDRLERRLRAMADMERISFESVF